jgi:hypothetical protein
MSFKRVVFEFPAQAWPGIVLALTQFNYPELVPNPEAQSDPTKPPMVANPKTRDEVAIEEVTNIIAQRFESWAFQERMKELEARNRAEVQGIVEQVKQATTAKVE